MFKFSHQYTFEVDFPVEKVWEYNIDLNNWYHTQNQVESLHLEDTSLRSGSIIKAKIKNINLSIPITVSEVIPLRKFQLRIKTLTCKQELDILFESIDSKKTRVTFNTTLRSILIPFLKWWLLKKLNKEIPENIDKMIQTLSQTTETQPAQH